MRTLILFLLFSISMQSQVVVGNFRIFKHDYPKNKQKEIDILKRTKTVFVLTPAYSVEEYTKAIAEVWDITPFEVIWYTTFDAMSQKEREDRFKRDEESFIKLNSFVYKINSTDFLYNTLDLKVYKFKNKDKKGEDIYNINRMATVLLTPSIKQRDETRFSKSIDPDGFVNYDLGHLKAYLKIINKKLKNNEYVSCFDEFSNKEALADLKTKKLYIPESVFMKYNPGSRTVGEDREENELLKDYKFPYEIVRDSKLSEMLTNNEEIYFLDYNQINADKFISVIDAKKGEIIYNEFTSISYNIKAKDLKAISNAIAKNK